MAPENYVRPLIFIVVYHKRTEENEENFQLFRSLERRGMCCVSALA